MITDSISSEDPLAAFAVQAERAAAVVHRCFGAAAVADLVASLGSGGPVSVSNGLVSRHPDVAVQLRAKFDLIHPRTAAEAAAASVGVSVGEALVVETGSVLVSEHALEDRLVSMLAPILVQVVAADAVMVSLDDVGAWLEARQAEGLPNYHALITGPSRSADIERSLTIGVQGPYELHIAILFPAADGGRRS